MTMQHAAVLDDRSVIALSGVGARGFLQGLVTNDLEQRAPGQAAYAALLTPQGKILFDFFVIEEAPDRFLIDCAQVRAADLLKRLTLYRLRAKIEIVLRPELFVAAIWKDHSAVAASGTVFTDPRLPALGARVIAPRQILDAQYVETAEAYQMHRLFLGVPDSADLPPDTVFPLDAGFEELNGVSFKKGCFVGQEVTARMKHRSSARRRFLIAEMAAPLPPFGTPVMAGRELGTLATGQGGVALAMVRLDRLAGAQTANVPVEAAGKTVTLRKPDWLRV